MLTFVVTDFGAYCYHRFLHTFETNLHTVHHENPHNNITIFKASIVSGTIATFASLKFGYIPVIYWFSVSCIHPLLHNYNINVPGMNYFKIRHEKHHENPSNNFGPYFPVFDLIFNTEYVK